MSPSKPTTYDEHLRGKPGWNPNPQGNKPIVPTPDPGQVNLKRLTVAELKELVVEKGLEPGKTKADNIALLSE
jgi:hypothetical protein